MTATRLTKDLRNTIHKVLMERAYVDRKKELEHMEHNLAMDVYNDTYPSSIQSLMEELPKSFFGRRIDINVAFNSYYYQLRLPHEVPFSFQHGQFFSNAINNYSENHEFTERFLQYKKLLETYKEDYGRLSAETSSILERCSTVKRLIETWPEVEPILHELNIPVSRTKETYLPAIIQDMNERFGLKKNKEDDEVQRAA